MVYQKSNNIVKESRATDKLADKSQIEKVWRWKNDGSPPPADMNQSMINISQPIKMDHPLKMGCVQENIIEEYVNCRVICLPSQQ